jgi:hypothetical protein
MNEAWPDVQSQVEPQHEWAVLMHELRTPLTVAATEAPPYEHR